MIGASGNGASGYRVVESPAVLKELSRLIAGVNDPARLLQCTKALRSIRRRLRADPLGFGEYLHPLWGLRLEVYLASVAPLAVRYGVH